MAILIALAHTIPIFFTRAKSSSQWKLVIVTGLMALVAIQIGNPDYLGYDIIAIAAAYLICNSTIGKSTPPKSSESSTRIAQNVEFDPTIGILLLGAIIVGGYFIFKSEFTSNPPPSSKSASYPRQANSNLESAVTAKDISKKAVEPSPATSQKKIAPIPSTASPIAHDEGMTKWTKVYSDEKFTGYVGQISKNQDGITVTMWELNDLKTFTGIKGSSIQYISSKAQYEYDCEKELSRRISFSYHSGSMGSGETVHANSELGEWSPVALGTRDRNFWQFACKKS